MGGLVLGMARTIVIPPASAAAVPDAMSSFSVPPGSLRWTWTSIRPTATSLVSLDTKDNVYSHLTGQSGHKGQCLQPPHWSVWTLRIMSTVTSLVTQDTTGQCLQPYHWSVWTLRTMSTATSLVSMDTKDNVYSHITGQSGH